MANVKAHLGDAIPGRKLDGCPYGAVEVNLVVFEVVAGAGFVGAVNAKAGGNINGSMGVGSDGTVNVNRKWRCEPAAIDLAACLFPQRIGIRKAGGAWACFKTPLRMFPDPRDGGSRCQGRVPREDTFLRYVTKQREALGKLSHPGGAPMS